MGAPLPGTFHAARFPAAIENVLVVASAMLDPRATATALAAMHARAAVRIHLLAIQQLPNGHAGPFLRAIDMKKVRETEASELLAPLVAELEASGTPYRTHVETGAWLETIAGHVRDLGCGKIVVGDNRLGAWQRLLLRHDQWRIASYLRRSGFEVDVVRLDEVSPRNRASTSRAVASHS
jgi:hypothetical protein